MGLLLDVFSDWSNKLPSLFDALLRKIYKQELLENKVVIDVSSNDSAICAQLLDNATIQITLRVANFSPFELTVENITLEFIWNGLSNKIYHNNFIKIPRCSEKEIYITQNLSSEDALKIASASNQSRNKPRITYIIDFSNRLYRFQKYGEIRSFNLDLVNADHVIKTLPKKAS